MSFSWIGLGSAIVCIGLSFTSRAAAHIRLSEPLARYEITGYDVGIKGCPCGLATGGGKSNRTCKVALDGSDPNRDESRASTFPAGSTIKLKFEEYVAHDGRYRVAFDPDGADFEDFNSNVLFDEPDPSGNQGNIGDGSKWELEVTLPNVECDNCTLQLLQVMEGGTENPVNGDNLANLSTYYTCIDITLTAPEGDTSGETTSGDSSASDTSTATTTAAAATETTIDTNGGELGTGSEGSTSGNGTTTAPSSSRPETATSAAASSANSPTSMPASAATTSTAALDDTTTDAADTTTDDATNTRDEGSGGDGGCSVSTPTSNTSLGTSSASLRWMLVLGAAAGFFVRRRVL